MQDIDKKIDDLTTDSYPNRVSDEHRIALTQIAIERAVRSWADEKVSQFGRWSLKRLWFALVAAVLYFILTHGSITLPELNK